MSWAQKSGRAYSGPTGRMLRTRSPTTRPCAEVNGGAHRQLGTGVAKPSDGSVEGIPAEIARACRGTRIPCRPDPHLRKAYSKQSCRHSANGSPSSSVHCDDGLPRACAPEHGGLERARSAVLIGAVPNTTRATATRAARTLASSFSAATDAAAYSAGHSGKTSSGQLRLRDFIALCSFSRFKKEQ
jgi:hypothetical protein